MEQGADFFSPRDQMSKIRGQKVRKNQFAIRNPQSTFP